MHRVRVLIVVLFAFLIVSRLTQVGAVSATSISVASIVDLNNNCTQLQVDVSIIDRVGDTADGLLDYYYVVVYDGNGNPHASDSLGAAVPTTNNVLTTIDQTYHGTFTARPMRVVMYDVTSSGTLPLSTVESAPIVVETTFDPVGLVPSCGATPATAVPLASTMTNDGRQNALDLYPYQTATVYCREDGTVDIYGIDPETAEGNLALRVNADSIADSGIPQESNMLLDESSNGTIQLYRLTSGELQVMAPDDYIFIWDGCR